MRSVDPVVIGPDTRVADAMPVIDAGRLGLAIVGDGARRPLGIVTGVDGRKGVRPEQSGSRELRGDGTRACTGRGRRPAGGVADGLIETVQWMRTHLDQYRPDECAV